MENKNDNSINYLEIIKKSFWITWQNRYLWWLGFFIAFTGGGMRLFNFSPEKKDSQNVERVWNFISSNLSWIIPMAIFLFLLLVLLIVLGTIAKAGIVRATEKIEKKENFSFKNAMLEGKKYFWKFFFLSAILSIALGIIAAIMFAPIVTLFAVKSYVIAGILIFLAIIIFIPLAVIFAFIKIFGQIYLVLGNITLKDSIENAYHLFLKNIKKSILMALLFIPIALLLGFIVLTFALILLVVFGLLGLAMFFILKTIGVIIVAGLAIILFLIFLLAVASFYQAFSQIIWVLFFKEIAAPKVEEILKEIAQEETTIQKNPEPASGISTSKID